MNTTEVHITQPDLRKLLATASADAALLYLFLQGNCRLLRISPF